MQYAEGSYESIYGTIRSRWECREKKVKLYVEIPCNTTAEIWLEDAVSIEYADNLLFRKAEESEQNGYRAEASSGDYEITFLL